MKQRSGYTARLFYSYSHKDSRHRESMEKSLALLSDEGLLKEWSDQAILPGQEIPAATRASMDKADIVVFLLSHDFIASQECMKEWRYVKGLSTSERPLFRVPIVVRECSWKDLLAADNIKALPQDGQPIVQFDHEDTAWQQVYEGIKAILNQLRMTFTAKSKFLTEMEETEFISQQHLNLRDLFVFLPLSYQRSNSSGRDRANETIATPEDLLEEKYSLIHGYDRSGKTALGRFMFLTLVEQSRLVLHLDLNCVRGRPKPDFLRETYESQFHGDFSLWSMRSDKTLILDNLSSSPHLINFVVSAKESFDRIIITLSSDVFYSFFRDDSRLADFLELKIGVLTHSQQEALIRKRLSLSQGDMNLTDGFIDQVENRINSIIISDRIVPRYPFFVLSILQTYEAFMPSGMTVTSYGHCYYTLIVASLVRAGISKHDNDINACFNLAERLAYSIHQHREGNDDGIFDFSDFIREYKDDFFIADSIISRLKDEEFGLLTEEGQFHTPYVYYFFLGKFLSKDSSASRTLIGQMCDSTHVPSNFLTLLFTIHHTTDDTIIDDILLRTMCTFDDAEAASLDRKETRRFRDLWSRLPDSILSIEGVESSRESQRSHRDQSESEHDGLEEDGMEDQELVNGCYRILKNSEIMGQILRNKYGTLNKPRVEEIIEIMAEGGLRLVNLVLKDENEILEMARYLKAKNSDYDIQDIKRGLEVFSFIWTMLNIERIVGTINFPEIRPAIKNIVERTDSPAFDVIGFFAQLDTAQELGNPEKTALTKLFKKHEDPFVRRVLSIRTQRYMNTHRSNVRIEQAICALLGIKYVRKLIQSQ